MVIDHQLCHEDKILIDFGIFNSVPKVLDQTHCIVERNCFYRDCLWDQYVFCYKFFTVELLKSYQ